MKLLSLKYRRDIALLKQMFRCTRDGKYIDNTCNRHGRLANRIRIKSEFPRTDKYRSIVYQSPKKWDLLPNGIKEVETLMVFKKKLHLYFRSKFLNEKKTV